MLKKVIALSLLVTIVSLTLTGCIYIDPKGMYKGDELFKVCSFSD